MEVVYLIKYPSSGRCHIGVYDAVEAVEEVVGFDRACGVGRCKEFVLMEIDIVSQDECVAFPIGADVPSFGNAGLRLQLLIEADESVVELGTSPNDSLVFGKGGVERGDSSRFVVAEDLFVAVVGDGACDSQQSRQEGG